MNKPEDPLTHTYRSEDGRLHRGVLIITKPITIETRWGPKELSHTDFMRFWAKVFIPAEEDPKGELCWEWAASTVGGGRYGGLSIYIPRFRKDFMIPATHIALASAGVVVPRGQVARHVCPLGPFKRCVRPSHLRVGTHADNARDRIEWEERLAQIGEMELD